MDEGSIIE